MPNKRHRFLAGFVDAMTEVLDSLKPPVHPPISNDVQVSNAADSKTDLDTDEKNEKPESEDEVQAAPPAESRRHQPALHSAAGLEDKVPAVRVDNDGRAYLTECEIVFPNRDEVWLISPSSSKRPSQKDYHTDGLHNRELQEHENHLPRNWGDKCRSIHQPKGLLCPRQLAAPSFD